MNGEEHESTRQELEEVEEIEEKLVGVVEDLEADVNALVDADHVDSTNFQTLLDAFKALQNSTVLSPQQQGILQAAATQVQGVTASLAAQAAAAASVTAAPPPPPATGTDTGTTPPPPVAGDSGTAASPGDTSGAGTGATAPDTTPTPDPGQSTAPPATS